MLNNVNPAFLPNAQLRTTGSFVPPSSVRTIGDALSEKNISWAYYGRCVQRGGESCERLDKPG